MNNILPISPLEIEFLIDLVLALICGLIIGIERERKNKAIQID